MEHANSPMPLKEKGIIVLAIACWLILSVLSLRIVNTWDRDSRNLEIKAIEKRAEEAESNRLKQEKVEAENKAAEERGRAKAAQKP